MMKSRINAGKSSSPRSPGKGSIERAPVRWGWGTSAAIGLAFLLVALGLTHGAALGPHRSLAGLAAYWTALSWAGARVARWLVESGDAPSRLTTGLTVTFGLAVTPAVLLGHLGVLSARNALLGAAAILLASQWIPLAPRLPRATTGVREPRWHTVSARWALIVSALTVAIALGAAVRSARYVVPGAYQFDDISYHLTAAAEWYRHGDLRMVKPGFGDPSPAFYPIAAELIAWTHLALLDGADFVARVTELPFALGCLAAIAAIACTLGMGSFGMLTSVLLLVTIPRMFPDRFLSAGNDCATAFFVLATIHAILLFARRPGVRGAAYTGWAAGLLVGTKYTALVFAPPLLGFACLAGAATRITTVARARRKGWTALSPLLLFATVAVTTAFLAGGYTYLRNLLTAANPVYPAQVVVADHVLLAGRPAQTPERIRQHPLFPIGPWEFLWKREDLFGPLFRWTMLPAALAGPAVALLLPSKRRRRRSTSSDFLHGGIPAPRILQRIRTCRERLLVVAMLGLPTAFYFGFVHFMADHRDVRYLIAAIGLSAVAFAWLLESAPAALRDVGALAVSIAVPPIVVLHLALETPVLVASVPPLLASALPLFLWRSGTALSRLVDTHSKTGPRRKDLRHALSRAMARPLGVYGGLLLAICLAIAIWLSLVRTFRTYDERRLGYDRAAAYVERLTRSTPAVIGYTGGNQPYLYFGSRLGNQVVYVPTHDAAGSRYYNWGSPLVMPRAVRDRQAWYRNLAQLDITYLVIRTIGAEQPELRWIERLPCCRELLWSDTSTRIYALEPGELSTYLNATYGTRPRA